MKLRKTLARRSPKRNAVHGLKARQAAYDALSANDKEGCTRPGSYQK